MQRFSVLASLLAVVLSLGLLTPAHAQGPGNSGPPGPAGPPATPTAVPLDSGATLLLAAGVGLGLRQLRLKRKHSRFKVR